MTATQAVDAFRDSLDRVNAARTTTTREEFGAVVGDLIEEPAVGAPLPFEGVSLPEAVETDPSPADLEAAATGITPARCAVADYGSVVVESRPAGDEAASLFPDEHVAVVRAGDVHPDMVAAFEDLGDLLRDGGSAVLATGPSATADMGDLVLGAHGPERVHVVILEER